jgi:hypothetical protein
LRRIGTAFGTAFGTVLKFMLPTIAKLHLPVKRIFKKTTLDNDWKIPYSRGQEKIVIITVDFP